MSPSCILDSKELNPAHQSQSLSHTHLPFLPLSLKAVWKHTDSGLASLSLNKQFARKMKNVVIAYSHLIGWKVR